MPVAGQPIVITAVDSTIPGACVDGEPEYQFTRSGVIVQPFGPKSFYLDAPDVYSPLYSVQVRCSSDPTCTSVVGASIQLAIYDGVDTESDGVVFGTNAPPYNAAAGVIYDKTAGTTTLNFVSATAGPVDVYKGGIAATTGGNGFLSPGPGWQHVATTCFRSNLPIVATNATTGPLDQTADPNPPIGSATFYAANAASAGTLNGSLGCVNPALCFGCPLADPSPYRVISSASPASANACQP